MTFAKVILWLMQGANITAFVYMQWKAGRFTHKSYFWFCAGSMLGQLGTVIEGVAGHAYEIAIAQGFFFLMMGVGVFRRYEIMRSEQKGAPGL